MKRPRLIAWPILAGLALAQGCATQIGKDFRHDFVPKLQLGETSEPEATEALGEPARRVRSSTMAIEFEQLHYSYGEIERDGGGRGRALSLEFRDDRLNAYLYLSSFSEDGTSFNYSAYKGLKIGTSTWEDAMKTMGKPSGAAVCPSSLIDELSTICAKGRKILVWRYAIIVKEKPYKSSVWISFDDRGIVSEISSREEMEK